MLSLITNSLFGKLTPKMVAALAIVTLLVVAVWQIDSRAYKRGYAASESVWIERVEIETERQVAANERAFNEALQRVEQLKQAKEVRDATIARLNEEARMADDADAIGLSADSVRRLNESD